MGSKLLYSPPGCLVFLDTELPYIIAGDFNIHQESKLWEDFSSILNMHNLTSLPFPPAHIGGRILDLFIYKGLEFSSATILDNGLSDPFCA